MRSHISDSLRTWYQYYPVKDVFMSSQNASFSSNYDIDSTNQGDNPIVVDNEIRFSMSDTLTDLTLFDISAFGNLSEKVLLYWNYEYLARAHEAYQQTSKVHLNEVRREAEEAYTLDNQIDPIPQKAYDDVLILLKEVFHSGIPMPEFSWAEDGSLSLTWFLENGIATMGLYGDDIVIYSVFCEEKRQVEGVCELSDIPVLSGFLSILSNILRR
ncbi:hypothetical protein F4X73_00470 [Candidatus Poribacteria bacterium]|nr:hypothetical protein [Candidatus Poribacteria bacterium]MYF56511.1 hypothetical protein [Candidatus Poribacteria bacterium]